MSKDQFSYAAENAVKSYSDCTCGDCNFFSIETAQSGYCYYDPPTVFIVGEQVEWSASPKVSVNRKCCSKFSRRYIYN